MTYITIIGGGKMGEALIAGIARVISQGQLAAELGVVEADSNRAAALKTQYEVGILNLDQALAQSDVLLIAVKPNSLVALAKQMRDQLTNRQVVISVAAGASIEFLAQIFGDRVALVRAMPNTPALLGKGITGVSFAAGISTETRSLVKAILGSVGQVVEIAEQYQDCLTAVSGSGPAYFFRFVEVLATGGEQLGLPPEVAQQLARQTLIGAAAMLEQTDQSPTTLRENVTSPNGTTQAALDSFNQNGLPELVFQAEQAAAKRSAAMTSELLDQINE